MDVTREELASLINGKGVKITRGDLWGALQRIPAAGEFATHGGAAPYAQALLLSILAHRDCESCRRGDNGGVHSCGCPVPCGARYCQHPLGDLADPWAADEVVDAHICCDHALTSLASGELDVMDKIASLLRPYPQRTVKRVLEWATDYLTDLDQPPF